MSHNDSDSRIAVGVGAVSRPTVSSAYAKNPTKLPPIKQSTPALEITLIINRPNIHKVKRGLKPHPVLIRSLQKSNQLLCCLKQSAKSYAYIIDEYFHIAFAWYWRSIGIFRPLTVQTLFRVLQLAANCRMSPKNWAEGFEQPQRDLVVIPPPKVTSCARLHCSRLESLNVQIVRSKYSKIG